MWQRLRKANNNKKQMQGERDRESTREVTRPTHRGRHGRRREETQDRKAMKMAPQLQIDNKTQRYRKTHAQTDARLHTPAPSPSPASFSFSPSPHTHIYIRIRGMTRGKPQGKHREKHARGRKTTDTYAEEARTKKNFETRHHHEGVQISTRVQRKKETLSKTTAVMRLPHCPSPPSAQTAIAVCSGGGEGGGGMFRHLREPPLLAPPLHHPTSPIQRVRAQRRRLIRRGNGAECAKTPPYSP